MGWFWLGLIVGVLLTAPLVVMAARRAERRVRRLAHRARAAERLAELGMLTGGLAHEIKNPLSSVKMNIQLMREDLGDAEDGAEPGSQLRDRLRRIGRRADALAAETQRLHDILDDFLRFAGRIKLDRVATDVNHLVSEVADFFTPQAQASGVRISTQLGAQPPDAAVDPGLLKQALLNLMINACQAMTDARGDGRPSGGNGELMIRTQRSRHQDQDELDIHVIDTGPGIAPDKMDKVFQPYFSTKAGGTGLGLPTARRIIEEHGGTLTVHSAPGQGTDFTMALPIAPSDHA